MDAQEFEQAPVNPENLKPARHFAANYSGEHVAGTEFVIGATFVAWGVGTMDIILGLLLGNLLAVLTWTFICAPIAVDTRLTLYAYLEKIAGPGTIRLYSVVNGVLFCILAGSMITVSASAVRILFNIPPQVNWYPTSIGFVLVALVVGAVVVVISAKGFKRVAQFAEICAPWMVLMFLVGALALIPVLVAATPGLDNIGSFSDFRRMADLHIWQGTSDELGFWHVAAFAWVANLAMHGSLSDMTILRYAKKYQYGYFSGLGMFIGHYFAWIFAGIMGAGAGLVLQTSVTNLDAGAVAFQALGAAGILAVIIAGWTTSNPTIYRAGLAFQSLNPKWNRVKVTIITGSVTAVISCFPFVFTRLLDFVGLMGLTLAPVGAVIVAEHWLFPKLGLTRYWASYMQRYINWAAIIAWGGSLLFAYLINVSGLHLFFLLIPTWIFATVLYVILASVSGARLPHAEQVISEKEAQQKRKLKEQAFLENADSNTELTVVNKRLKQMRVYRTVALLSLFACLVLALATYAGTYSLEGFRTTLLWPSLLYFVSATLWIIDKEKHDSEIEKTSSNQAA